MGKTLPSTPVPAVGEGKRGEQGHIGYLLRQAQTAHRQRMEQALADSGLTLPQFMVLTMLMAYPGASGADLARVSLLTPQTVSVIVTNLERSGAIERHAHAVHGRIQQIEVTALGRQLLAASRGKVKRVEDELLAGLSAAEEKIIRRWLVRIASAP
jgi:DNA-binding MarR family transcriptional regulator